MAKRNLILAKLNMILAKKKLDSGKKKLDSGEKRNLILAKRNAQLKGSRRTLLDAQNNQSGTKRGAGAGNGEHKI